MAYETRIFYKFTAIDGRPQAAHRKAKWSLPVEGADGAITPGNWRSVRGELQPCFRGLHVATPEQLIHWIGRELYAVEVCTGTSPRGMAMLIEHESTKWVARRARLVRRVESWDDAARNRFDTVCFRAGLRAAEHALTGREGAEHPYLGIGRRTLAILESGTTGPPLWEAVHEIQEEYNHTPELTPEMIPFLPDRRRAKLNANQFGWFMVSTWRTMAGMGYTTLYAPYLRLLREIRDIHRMTYAEIAALTDESVQRFFPDLIAADEAAHAARVTP
jgi:hypothetical protein